MPGQAVGKRSQTPGSGGPGSGGELGPVPVAHIPGWPSTEQGCRLPGSSGGSLLLPSTATDQVASPVRKILTKKVCGIHSNGGAMNGPTLSQPKSHFKDAPPAGTRHRNLGHAAASTLRTRTHPGGAFAAAGAGRKRTAADSSAGQRRKDHAGKKEAGRLLSRTTNSFAPRGQHTNFPTSGRGRRS